MAIARSTHGARRSEVLARLQQATAPIGVAELASSTGLHVNTARFHLDRLVEEGLATRQSETGIQQPTVRGRPRVLYSALAPEPSTRSYRLIAEMLTDIVASLDHNEARVHDVGRIWGRRLVTDVTTASEDPQHPSSTLHQLDATLAAMGFEQTHDHDDAGTRLEVTRCPVRDIAGQHPEIVCTAHRGLIEGALQGLSIPLEVEELHPFQTPNTCVATLRATLGR